MSGGLGNQMFEYALYLKLRSMGKEVKMDDFTCYGPGERKKQLDVFGIHYDVLTKAEYDALTDSNMEFSQRLRRKLTGRKDFSYREKSSDFDAEVLRREPALFLGYFQTEKYFADIKEQVREAFQFRNYVPTEAVREMEKAIRGCNGISVHIRRGDYLDPKYSALYEGICTDRYYEQAIGEMKKRYPDARFFFFSNDIEWVKENYSGPDCVIVEGNGEDSGFADLYLMSRCSHHIIANSSFSWWGAWLNPNPHKTVIAPKRWLNGRECRDIYTKEMTLL